MSPFPALVACLLALAGLTAFTPVAPVETLAGGQTGRIQFRTLTLSATQFLTGAKGGKPVVIWGDLRLPRAGAGHLPAVVLVHGSGGVGTVVERWAEEINGIGVAAFILDSFTGRGILQTADDQSRLGSGSMMVDAFRALRLLSTHPRIDPARIAVMGFSKGGIVSLYASLRRFRRMHGPEEGEFAAYLAFYPFCGFAFAGDEQVSDQPIRIFHGAADDYTPIVPCREYVGRLRRAGKDVRLIEYRGAPHGFDNPHLPPARFLSQVVNPTRCAFLERPIGRLLNRETGQPLDFNDPCFSRGATVGYNPRAHRQAVQAVKTLLMTTFKLGP
ncbi:MAG: dienelactone hydrolase family protein [Candidatus Methylomirabilia bacterium]